MTLRLSYDHMMGHQFYRSSDNIINVPCLLRSLVDIFISFLCVIGFLSTLILGSGHYLWGGGGVKERGGKRIFTLIYRGYNL
jgi:hypothetical protein